VKIDDSDEPIGSVAVVVDACFAETVMTAAALARWKRLLLKNVRKAWRRKWNVG
jgi:hypothetical protein